MSRDGAVRFTAYPVAVIGRPVTVVVVAMLGLVAVMVPAGSAEAASASYRVEARLRTLGYPTGTVDGVVTVRTRQALCAWRETHGLPVGRHGLTAAMPRRFSRRRGAQPRRGPTACISTGRAKSSTRWSIIATAGLSGSQPASVATAPRPAPATSGASGPVGTRAAATRARECTTRSTSAATGRASPCTAPRRTPWSSPTRRATGASGCRDPRSTASFARRRSGARSSCTADSDVGAPLAGSTRSPLTNPGGTPLAHAESC